MPKPIEKDLDIEDDEQDPGDPPKGSGEYIPRARFNEVNQALKDTRKELADLRKELKDSTERSLEEQGNWQKLAEERGRELSKLQGASAKLEQYETVLSGILEKEKTRIPEHYQSLVPESLPILDQLTWITANAPILSKKAPPKTGAGVIGGKDVTEDPEITEEEKAVAKKFGMSLKEYIQYRDMNADNLEDTMANEKTADPEED